MPDLSLLAWVALAIAAVTVGISKTAIPGANVAVAIFAAVLPARPSTAALLLLLIVADLFAVAFYRRHADWAMLRRLAPPVLIGVVLGTVFLGLATDALVGRVIGAILIAVITLGLVQRYRARRREAVHGGGADPGPAPWWQSGIYGSLGGFTTMVANAAGPIMAMYFLAARLNVRAFLGTAAWFFLAVNLTKVPFAAGLGLYSSELLLMDLALVPFVILGALVGKAIANRIKPIVFEWLVIVLSIAGAVYLLVG